MRPLHSEILRVLLYYDIWAYPLTLRELFTFLPIQGLTLQEFEDNLRAYGPGPKVNFGNGHYFIGERGLSIVEQRAMKEQHARKLWVFARISMHIIKRFPFVRGIFVSGDLSKNATTSKSDVDFFIITEPNRLWITRTLLILFKKTVLLDKKKFFCVNYFATSDHLRLDNENIFLAAEIAHLKPLYNSELFLRYLEENKWIKTFYPGFDIRNVATPQVNNRRSYLQKLFEIPFLLIPADRLDSYLLMKMKAVWARRYPECDSETRERIFRCTKHESRAYVGNFEEKILLLYDRKLREYGIAD